MRPILRPGTHVLAPRRRRAPGRARPARRAGAPRQPRRSATRSPAARRLGRPRRARRRRHRRRCSREHDLLVDERALLPLLGRRRTSPPPPTAALARAAGAGCAGARRARAGVAHRDVGFGHPAGDRLRGDLVALLASGRAARAPAAGRRPTAACSSASASRDRELLDALDPRRDAVPRWSGSPRAARSSARSWCPGTTACLRCLDAHHTDADPAWPLLVRQYAAASPRDRADGAPEPVDPLLAALAAGLGGPRPGGVRRRAAGPRPGRPPSRCTPGLAELETPAWLRHPACGCSWD